MGQPVNLMSPACEDLTTEGGYSQESGSSVDFTGALPETAIIHTHVHGNPVSSHSGI